MIHNLSCLFKCKRDSFCVEVIVVINSYQISPSDIKTENRKSYESVKQFAEKNNTENFFLTPLLIEDLPGHQTGAGLPRKIGMDEAISHFKGENIDNGIIVSLDADTYVDENYLVEIYKAFRKQKLLSATIRFHHPIEYLSESDPIRKATILYEEYLHYYREALEFTGYPYAYFTIGSAFAVTAKAYKQVGGMGKQQAGEDFYFLQKVFPLGKTKFIDTTCVYPQARTSDRVPFGTGPAIAKMIEEETNCKLSYSFESFVELRDFFDQINFFFHLSLNDIENRIKELSLHMQLFLEKDNFLERINEIKLHTSSAQSFKKRFFSYFTAFKIIKYLNYVHPSIYPFRDVKKEYLLLKASKPFEEQEV
ncbi:hypothetical protein LJB98_04360 [Bacteroidales bacterium OttesenSCG-928-M11]|nr:hypothetical protein [Bacteroidales bacterium OttesenSCG-928-M11]